MPNKENETNMTPEQWPGVDGKSVYSEGLYVGYRYYDEHKINFTTGFPFGHGLSYTTFAYSSLSITGRNVSITVKNAGKVSGYEVVQLYLGFPKEAGEPPQQLKGFTRVFMEAGAESVVRFALSLRDTSVYDMSAHHWQPVHGVFSIKVGASSRDIRLEKSVTF